MEKNVLLILLVSVWIILSVVFGIYDLDISRNVVNQNSGWTIFLENYGMIPGMFVILSGIYIYCSVIKIKTNVWSYIQKIIFFLVSSGLNFYLFDILLNVAESNYSFTFLIISFSISIIVFTLLHIIKQVQNAIAIRYSKIVVGLALFGYVFGIQVTKYLWGRVRFRELDSAFSQFTPWYSPQGLTGFDSFPSGHAAMGWMLLALLILFASEKQWIKNSVLTIIIVLGILLATSRVVVGAHYASDVLFGSFFIILVFIILVKNSKQQASNDK